MNTVEKTVADRMKELGYVTGCIGKWHLGDEPEFYPQNRGFDEYYGTLGQGSYYSPKMVDSRNGDKGVYIKTPEYYLTDDYNARAVEFINQYKDQPFFLYLPHYAVHSRSRPAKNICRALMKTDLKTRGAKPMPACCRPWTMASAWFLKRCALTGWKKIR